MQNTQFKSYRLYFLTLLKHLIFSKLCCAFPVWGVRCSCPEHKSMGCSAPISVPPASWTCAFMMCLAQVPPARQEVPRVPRHGHNLFASRFRVICEVPLCAATAGPGPHTAERSQAWEVPAQLETVSSEGHMGPCRVTLVTNGCLWDPVRCPGAQWPNQLPYWHSERQFCSLETYKFTCERYEWLSEISTQLPVDICIFDDLSSMDSFMIKVWRLI